MRKRDWTKTHPEKVKTSNDQACLIFPKNILRISKTLAKRDEETTMGDFVGRVSDQIWYKTYTAFLKKNIMLTLKDSGGLMLWGIINL